MRKLIGNEEASVYSTIIYIICLGLISFFLLIGGEILNPFFSIMASGYMKQFLLILWPYGLAFAMFIILSYAYLMDMQKDKYKR